MRSHLGARSLAILCAVTAAASLAACSGDAVLRPQPGAVAPTATPSPTPAAVAVTPSPTPSPTAVGASPTPTPTATPSTAPSSSAISFSPTTLNFIYDPQETTGCVSSNAPQQFTAVETGFTGMFTAVSNNTTLATVTPTTSTGAFTVTASSVDKASSAATTVTVSDGAGHTNSIAITFAADGVCLP